LVEQQQKKIRLDVLAQREQFEWSDVDAMQSSRFAPVGGIDALIAVVNDQQSAGDVFLWSADMTQPVC
jgi:hypothetical protein